MCGIAGIYAYKHNASPVDPDELNRIRDAMQHRGPDDCGNWISDNREIALANRRLRIFDLSDKGHQPMLSQDGNIVLTFNGAIYNYRELRKELDAQGHVFRSTSDTEVLLQLYQEKGRAMLEVLRGMYAFAIWDQNKQQLFIARDPFGIKPLYYADDGKTLRFASEIKALLKSTSISRELDPCAAVGFHLLGSVPEPYTLLKAVKQVPAGHSLTITREGEISIEPFCRIEDILYAERETSALARSEAREQLAVILKDSVDKHLIADVPTGFFLSAGRDSGTLVGLAAELGHSDIHTVTLGFKEFSGTAHDESSLAEEVGRHYATRHKTIWVTKQDFKDSLPAFLNSMDQPTIDGLNSYFVSRVAVQSGLTVALSGLGGDELFSGYPSFTDIPRIVAALRFLPPGSPLGKGYRTLSAPFLKHLTSPKYAGVLEYGGSYRGAYLLRRGLFMPWELPEVLDPDIARAGWKELEPQLLNENQALSSASSPQARVSALELSLYMRNQLLRDTDWASMAHSLEVRTPLVDITVLRELCKVARQTDFFSKEDMTSALKKPLPERVRSRAKTGFAVPIRDWIAEDNPEASQARGLRGWAQYVFQRYVESVS